MDTYRQVADWLVQADSAVAFTGAGISTESGIPDFRSPGGIWSRTTPVMYDQFLASAAARYEYWRQKAIAHRDFALSQPNVGHRILARWQEQQRIKGVITQNIDGLHQMAGSSKVVELHGTARQIACLDCGARFDAQPLIDQFLASDAVPDCPRCEGRLKHATVSFGQALPEEVLQEAVALSENADLLLAMGSSLVVEPAASLPRLAKQRGATLVIINREPTPQDELADAVVHAPIGATLAQVAELLG